MSAEPKPEPKPDPAGPAAAALAPAAAAPAAAEGGAAAPNTITLRVKDSNNEETVFKVKRTTKMSKVFAAYAARKGVPEGQLRFLLDGERIQPTDTPEALALEDKDQIDAMMQQVGGGL